MASLLHRLGLSNIYICLREQLKPRKRRSNVRGAAKTPSGKAKKYNKTPAQKAFLKKVNYSSDDSVSFYSFKHFIYTTTHTRFSVVQ